MIWGIVAVLVAAALALFLYRRFGERTVSRDSYVCDVCGERHCICHREEKD